MMENHLSLLSVFLTNATNVNPRQIEIAINKNVRKLRIVIIRD